MPIKSQSVEIGSLVRDIQDKKLLLPELQRRYIWKSIQVRDLLDSLYHQYPSGQILVWQTDDFEHARTASLNLKDEKDGYPLQPLLLLDGQQRLTSLAAVLNNTDLITKDSKQRTIDIAFNVYTEKFEVAGPRQQAEKGWVSLRKLYNEGVLTIVSDLGLDSKAPETKEIYERLQRLDNVRTYRYNVSVLEQMTYDEVTHIFVRINSGGTKLNSADLALAQISSRWRGVTDELDKYYKAVKRRTNGELEIETGILIRSLSVIISSRTRLSELFRGDRQGLTEKELKRAWARVKKGMDQAIDFLSQNCKIDRLGLLPTQYILITLTAFFDYFENVDPTLTRGLQRWAYMALIWTRYSGTTETNVDQDVVALKTDDPVAHMIQNIEDAIGRNRPVTERELQGQLKQSPYTALVYVLARQSEAEDWFNGIRIGPGQPLEFHHIFPKDILREHYDLKADRLLTDQIANLAFLSQRANSRIKNKPPSEYLPEIPKERLRAQRVSSDKNLWVLDKFEGFLADRRIRLAEAINDLLDSLSQKPSLWPASSLELLEERIDIIERQMRGLIIQRLEDARGKYAQELIPSDIRKNLLGRSRKHQERNPAGSDETSAITDLLKFAQFSDYMQIVRYSWSIFKEDFGNETLLTQHYQAITTARNAFKHNNELSSSDRASAEAGLIWVEECLRTRTADADDDSEEE